MAVSTTHHSERIGALDSSKALAVIMVVMLHVGGYEFALNGYLASIRMPLFIFVSGIFASKSMLLPLRAFLTSKTFHLVWLYLFWSAVYYYGVKVFFSYLNGQQLDLLSYWKVIYDPMPTLWFIYVLAVCYTLTRVLYFVLPHSVITLLYLLLFIFSVRSNLWDGTQIERIMRLLIFFGVAVFYGQKITNLLLPRYRLWWVLILLYACLFAVSTQLGISEAVPMRLLSSAIGISAVLLFCATIDHMALGRLLAWIGGYTIFIFVLHRFFLYYFARLRTKFDFDMTPTIDVLLFIGLITLSLAFGHFILRPYFPFTEKAPWLLTKAPPMRR